MSCYRDARTLKHAVMCHSGKIKRERIGNKKKEVSKRETFVDQLPKVKSSSKQTSKGFPIEYPSGKRFNVKETSSPGISTSTDIVISYRKAKILTCNGSGTRITCRNGVFISRKE